MALQAGVGGGAVEQRHRLLAAELEGPSEVDRSLHVLVAVEMAKAAVGPGGGATGVVVDRGVEVCHVAREIDLLVPHHADAVVRSGQTGAHGRADEPEVGDAGARTWPSRVSPESQKKKNNIRK